MNGIPAVATDGSCETDEAEDCTVCNAGYTLNGQVCDGKLVCATFTSTIFWIWVVKILKARHTTR